jgi:hypothetical protein
MPEEVLFMSAKKPLYQLGDLIASYYESDGGVKAEIAYITGIEYKPPHTRCEDWWYYTRIIAGAGKVSHGEIPESEILGRVIHGT